MKDFENKTAVITGGASGIGFALARKALSVGMSVVIADIEKTILEQAAGELDAGDRLLTVVTDVSSSAAVDNLAERTRAAFGSAYLLFNNAGVGGGGPVWEQADADWDWVLGVNLRGVINGIRAFAPDMIAHNEGHIVNTASIAGLVSAAGTSTYAVSKHAVVALSEVLYGDLREIGADVGVSVLCPSFVNTNIYKFERNRPGYSAENLTAEEMAQRQATEAMTAEFFASALSPNVVADQVFDAIKVNRFYILTHPEGSRAQLASRMHGIVDGTGPAVLGAGEFPVS